MLARMRAAGVGPNELKAFFTTIAVLLGAGILGLPVRLSQTGFYPFIVILTLTLCLQLAVVAVQCDNLQHAQIQLDALEAEAEGRRGLPPMKSRSPDLHVLGKLYLGSTESLLFDALSLVMFMSALIGYALAGSQAFGSLLGVDPPDLILPFTLISIAGICFFSGAIQPVVSAFTGFKVLLLIFIIAVVGVVAHNVNLAVPQHDDWSTALNPFLIGTVALGGIACVMPVYMAQTPRDAASILRYRNATAAGVFMCYILNAFW